MIKSGHSVVKIVLLSVAIVNVSSCSDKVSGGLRNGDLAFQISAPDAMAEAITASTGHGEELAFTHVGIVQVVGDSVFVIEATGKHGVRRTGIEEFLAGSAVVDNQPVVRFYRLRGQGQGIADAAVQRALGYLGLPYDHAFQPGDSAFYCSELVYECFLDESGEHIFPSLSMTFKDSEGKFPQYWVDFFDRYGLPIPEGVSGTNPNDMSKAEVIEPLPLSSASFFLN